MKKAIFFIITLMVIVAIAVFIWPHQNQPRMMTFAECAEIGGNAWSPNTFRPDLFPTCESCNGCSPGSDNIVNCPNSESCINCMRKNHPPSGKCPDGKKKIAEISDAAIWFQCCK